MCIVCLMSWDYTKMDQVVYKRLRKLLIRAVKPNYTISTFQVLAQPCNIITLV